MKKLVKYIFFIFCFLTACQKPEIVEIPSFTPGEGVYGEATISLSVSIPRTKVETKAMGDLLSADLKNLYLIVFDENGYLVESRKAEYEADNINNGTEVENVFSVTLKLTDKKRIIHFIANCPEDQIGYGHENEMISRMYVKKGAVIETAYWNRTVVDNILTDGEGNLVGETANKFKRVPMLRNYSMITVVDNDDEDDFELLRWGLYNTIDRGTVAPYNKTTQTFQPFILNGYEYSYDELVGMGFEGHTLIDAKLNGDFTESDFLNEGDSYFMYERRINNAITGSNETPCHIILEGSYAGGQPTYYKVDLIEKVDNVNRFYHILRNIEYTFKLKSVSGPGYADIQEAMDNAASNNLSGSTQTQGLVSVSDGYGRIYVSFTSVTLVSNEDVTLRFKYIPDIENGIVDNSMVKLSGKFDGNGAVIKGINGNIKEDVGDGWGEVTFKIQDPSDIDKTQEIELLAGTNLNLHKTISFRLRNPFRMDVICYDSANSDVDDGDNVVDRGIGKRVGVEIRIPNNLFSDMFPLDLFIEADKLSISPDATNNTDFALPVKSGTSIIPGKNSPSFYYVCSIETEEAYKALGTLGDGANMQRVINTQWLTNIANSASHVVVDNKYFNSTSSYFKNEAGQTESDILEHKMVFTDLKIDPSPIFYGAGQKVNVSFKLDPREVDYLPKTVRIALEGLVCAQHSHDEFDIYLTEDKTSVPNDLDEHTWIVEMEKGSRTVLLDDLITQVTDVSTGEGPVSFTLSTEDSSYETASSGVVERTRPKFTLLSINPDPVLKGAGRKVSISFTMDANDEIYAEREVNITLNGIKKIGADSNQSITITPSSTSKTITIDDLETIDENSNISFVVSAEGYDAESGKSGEVQRSTAEFSNVKINPGKILSDGQTGKSVSVSFTMDLNDQDYANTPVTVKLTGMKVKDTVNQTEITVSPNSQSVTIDNLVTTVSSGVVSAEISAPGYTTKTATAEFFVPEFRNMYFTDENGTEVTSLRAGEEHIVDFHFDMTYFEDDMEVTVELDGFVPYDMPTSGPGSINEAATRAAKSYTFKPEGKKCTIKLKTDKNASTWSVKLSADGFITPEVAILAQQKNTEYKGNVTIESNNVDIGNSKVNVSVEFDSISIGNNYDLSYDSIEVSHTYEKKNVKATVQINGLTISAQIIDEETEVTVKLTVKYKDNAWGTTKSKSTEIKKKIKELKNLGLQLQN